jgi:hypothetical protein
LHATAGPVAQPVRLDSYGARHRLLKWVVHLRVHPPKEEQIMLKARKPVPQTLPGTRPQDAKAPTRSLPKPLDASAQRLVGGGRASVSTPRQGW